MRVKRHDTLTHRLVWVDLGDCICRTCWPNTFRLLKLWARGWHF